MNKRRMPCRLTLLVGVLFVGACASVPTPARPSEETTPGCLAQLGQIVAMPFDVYAASNRSPVSGMAVAEDVSTNLAKNSRFKVLEFMQYNKLIDEYKLQYSGMVSDEQKLKLAEQFGADTALLGSLHSLGSGELRLNLKLVLIKTRTTCIADSAFGTEGDLFRLEDELVAKLSAHMARLGG